MEVAIRDLRGIDLPNGFLETLGSLADVQLSVNDAMEIFRKRLRAGVRTYIATVGTRVVGTASLLVEHKFIHNGGMVGHIEDVAVHRDFQKHGIGKLLVRHAILEAEKAGCYKVILSCFEDRVPFYEAMGFHQHDVGMRIDLCLPEEACKSASSVIPMATTAR
jgi:glucosamine-phosphate N-acetyltransferase